MSHYCNSVSELALLLRENGDKLINATSKLSLSTNLLQNLNQSVIDFMANGPENLDFGLIYDYVQKTIALKILPDFSKLENNSKSIDIRLFKNLKLLEIKRLSSRLIKGLKHIRTQLEYLTCMHSLNALNEVLESCGDDKCQGFIWNKLKRAVFSHNNLQSLDNSLEFTPRLCSLDLSHNNLTNVEFLSCLPKLNFLNLSYNKLENIPYLKGEICLNLKTFILHNNLIEDIKEIVFLNNLVVLDIRHNSLIDFNTLKVLNHNPKLNNFLLSGNPFCFHPKFRQEVVQYLSGNKEEFSLDNRQLDKTELNFFGKRCIKFPLHKNNSYLDSLESLDSFTTVIRNNVEASSFSSVNEDDRDTNENIIRMKEPISEICMSDSGIVAENRPDTPSICSIGSSSSLHEDDKSILMTITTTITKYNDNSESDIEVISNPSESSIEILSRFSTNCT